MYISLPHSSMQGTELPNYAIVIPNSFPFSCASHFDCFLSALAFTWTCCQRRLLHPHSFPSLLISSPFTSDSDDPHSISQPLPYLHWHRVVKVTGKQGVRCTIKRKRTQGRRRHESTKTRFGTRSGLRELNGIYHTVFIASAAKQPLAKGEKPGQTNTNFPHANEIREFS